MIRFILYSFSIKIKDIKHDYSSVNKIINGTLVLFHDISNIDITLSLKYIYCALFDYDIKYFSNNKTLKGRTLDISINSFI